MKYHRTAISRKSLSTPVQFLVKNEFLYGNMLDYGCGRGGDVIRLTEAGYRIMGYDPNGIFSDDHILRQKYDMIICNFVLNVIEDKEERLKVELDVVNLLHNGGIAFLSVRNDRCVADGCTSTGTWQGYVEPQLEGWEQVIVNSKFKMWKYQKLTKGRVTR